VAFKKSKQDFKVTRLLLRMARTLSKSVQLLALRKLDRVNITSRRVSLSSYSTRKILKTSSYSLPRINRSSKRSCWLKACLLLVIMFLLMKLPRCFSSKVHQINAALVTG